MEQFRFSFWRQDYDDALRFARRATEKYPQSDVAHENYGMALLLTRQPEAAMAALLRAQELSPSRVLPLRASGIIYAAQGNTDKAMRQWRKALSVDPNDIMTLVAIGVQIAKQGSGGKGEEYPQRAYKLAPRNPAVINGYAHALYLAGDIQSAGDIVLAGGRYYEGNPSFERIRAKILGEIR